MVLLPVLAGYFFVAVYAINQLGKSEYEPSQAAIRLQEDIDYLERKQFGIEALAARWELKSKREQLNQILLEELPGQMFLHDLKFGAAAAVAVYFLLVHLIIILPQFREKSDAAEFKLVDLPTIDAVVRELAVDVGIEPPNKIEIWHDCRIRARSSGAMGRSKGRLIVGVWLLVVQDQGHLRSAIVHELNHLKLRQNSLAISVIAFLSEYVPKVVSLHKVRFAAIYILVPSYWLISALWLITRAALVAAQREEENLVDAMSAKIQGPMQYAQSLVAHKSLVAKVTTTTDGVKKTDEWNGLLHCKILASADAEERPNLFTEIDCHDALQIQITEAVFDGPKGPFTVHLPLGKRLKRMGVETEQCLGAELCDRKPLLLSTAEQHTVSHQVVKSFRALAYDSKIKFRYSPSEGFSGGVLRYYGFRVVPNRDVLNRGVFDACRMICVTILSACWKSLSWISDCLQGQQSCRLWRGEEELRVCESGIQIWTGQDWIKCQFSDIGSVIALRDECPPLGLYWFFTRLPWCRVRRALLFYSRNDELMFSFGIWRLGPSAREAEGVIAELSDSSRGADSRDWHNPLPEINSPDLCK
ncbi:MAG: hypothetical protein AAFX06_14190 [Planctomycetota bacterium]